MAYHEARRNKAAGIGVTPTGESPELAAAEELFAKDEAEVEAVVAPEAEAAAPDVETPAE